MSLDKVLVAVGPGDLDRAVRLAEETVDIAGPSGATVLLVHAFTRDEYGQTLEDLGVEVKRKELSSDYISQLNEQVEEADITPDEVAARNATIRDLVKILKDAGVDYEVRGSVGNPGEKVVDLAEDEGVDMIVVGGRKRSPTGKAVFGSTAQTIMLSSSCPVLYVRAGME